MSNNTNVSYTVSVNRQMERYPDMYFVFFSLAPLTDPSRVQKIVRKLEESFPAPDYRIDVETIIQTTQIVAGVVLGEAPKPVE